MLEGKLKDPEAVREALSTACSAGPARRLLRPCGGADIVLEGRRMITDKPHWLVRAATHLMVERPGAFVLLLKGAEPGQAPRPFRSGPAPVEEIGVGGLAEADAHVAEAPLTSFMRS